ncbi:MAG: hypothetical protein JSV50_01375, partial [Desulfobacteraceae bacterium]
SDSWTQASVASSAVSPADLFFNARSVALRFVRDSGCFASLSALIACDYSKVNAHRHFDLTTFFIACSCGTEDNHKIPLCGT